MATLIRFGKPAGPLLEHKQSFFKNNAALLARAETQARLYASQPRRTNCKNCDYALGQVAFRKLGVDYFFCSRCGHLNGGHEDTAEFCDALYTDAGGADYAQNYAATEKVSWDKRRDDIYRPKAAFLVEALSGEMDFPSLQGLSFADFGAGSGYFVGALRAEGLKRVVGYEVSEYQVGLANMMLGETLVTLHEARQIVTLAHQVSADVVSLVGVLEHLRDPRGMLAALSENPRVQYIYVSVPLFSLSVLIELAFPRVMPRHLSGGHTHLYTDTSITWFTREFGFKRIAEWWFGTDAVDLYRSLSVEIEWNGEKQPPEINNLLRQYMTPCIDELQLVLDQRKQSSEVHVLLRKE